MYRPEIKVLDCSIRDGGLMNKHQFSLEFVRKVYKAVSDAKVDYIELGYRNSKEMFSPDEYGSWKFCDDEDILRVTDGIESNAKISVMGGAQASNVLLNIKLRQMEKGGKEFTDNDKKKLLEDIQKSYDEKSSALYAASRLWIDEVIDPAETRTYISKSIEIANNNPEFEKFNVGVIQT